MSDQLFNNGDVLTTERGDLELASVSYQETDGERHNFVYNFRLKSEIDAEREAEAKHQEELAAAQAEAEATAEAPADTENETNQATEA